MNVMASSNLPPLRNLPSWSRVRDLDRVRYPRLLSSDSVARSPSLELRPQQALPDPITLKDTRVASLQRDIHFLQQQQKETLERLHTEIDQLRRANKAGSSWSGSVSSKSCRTGSTMASSAEKDSTMRKSVSLLQPIAEASNPNSEGLQRIKKLLRDIVSKNKVPAEIFSLIGACDESRAEIPGRLPKLPLKPRAMKQYTSEAAGEAVILPSIKHSFGSRSRLERQTRVLDGQRTRRRLAL
ncbi:hypothetical protein DNTS_026958 [Danionella cerebrum]|uniref:Uncharacterized protein n=1 Tax=Danionella cerebrum TaxID=2873325 RepID=A0A553N535_9TELE|nr:hypothetical protein DNTS_026958 [Danionella translucida]